MVQRHRIVLRASAIFIASWSVIEAHAGAFALREQDAVGQGDGFAGVAAGGSIGSMFWNPATMTQIKGGGIAVNAAGILPNSDIHTGVGSTFGGPPFNLGGASNTGSAALLPSVYSTWQLNPNLWLGLAVNSPFGLSVTFPDAWAGRGYALGSSVSSYNANPSVAMRITDWLSVGVGAQLQFARADLMLGLGLPPSAFAIHGSGWGYGFTAGATITPTQNTAIGIGVRSALDQKIDGSLVVNANLPATAGPVNATVKLPDVVSAGIRQRVDDRWMLLGTVEWTNWSRIGTSVFNQPSGGPATIAGLPVALPFQYRDGWYYSLGAEYAFDARTTFRGGVAYETSPITDRVRIPLLPDSDRFSLSAGISLKMAPSMTLDLGYTHIWFKNANLNISSASGNPWFTPPVSFVGDASVDVNIFSVGFRYLFDAPASTPGPRG
jgi:long-chain fatty acid transport protein